MTCARSLGSLCWFELGRDDGDVVRSAAAAAADARDPEANPLVAELLEQRVSHVLPPRDLAGGLSIGCPLLRRVEACRLPLLDPRVQVGVDAQRDLGVAEALPLRRGDGLHGLRARLRGAAVEAERGDV